VLEFWRNERVEVTPLYNPLSLPSARSSSFRARAHAAAPRVPVLPLFRCDAHAASGCHCY
jgi:hypothetical protein